jgi:putative Holliday junction resolvase
MTKYLGIDFGIKRVGIAVSDAMGTIAFPRVVLVNDETLLSRIAEIIKTENAEAIVVGDTNSHSGAKNPVSAQADAFVEKLKETTKLPVERSWEVWSTMEVSKLATKGHEHDDASAAAFILQRYLDMKKQAPGEDEEIVSE